MAVWIVPSISVITLLCFGLPYNSVTAQSDDCTYVDFTEDKCRGADTITVAGIKISKNTRDYRVKLPGLQTEVVWKCGDTKERAAWDGGEANQLRVSYLSDGNIQWTVYKCNDLSGPKSAGLECGIPESMQTCPKFNDKSPACLWELKISQSNVHSKTTTVTLDATLRAEVSKSTEFAEAKASAEVKAGVSNSVTEASIFTYESKSFLVIPAGFSFCSFSNSSSVADVHSPTGFRWECSFTRFVQMKGKANNGMCSSLKKCDPGVCGTPFPASGATSIHFGISVLTLGLVASFSTFLNTALHSSLVGH